ncbi:LIM domain kinase 1 [Caerostris extrusa]|uniref:LIM domain kinase 1 n=1 Tax=Caerostris extrusa TaxID=172846 RepID=A0AAV4WB08_CAEEX|nr:LIM domain kinase 1 [Caerostris extrusa]
MDNELASMEHFAYTLFAYEYKGSEAFNILLNSLNSEECLILKRAWKTLIKMNDIYGKIFHYYFEKLDDDYFLYSKRDFAVFVLVKSSKFCRSPSFYNFLLVCLFMRSLLQSQPECLLLHQIVAKCLFIVFKEQYADFFMANGGLVGMRKYFDEIKEDLRSFVSRHANSENGGILIPTFEDVFKIVTEFDEYDFMEFGIGDSELEYVYDYHPFDEILIIRDTLKLPESPVTLNIEDENYKIEYLLHELGNSSVEAVFVCKQLKADELVMLPRCCLNQTQRPVREPRTRVIHQQVKVWSPLVVYVSTTFPYQDPPCDSSKYERCVLEPKMSEPSCSPQNLTTSSLPEVKKTLCVPMLSVSLQKRKIKFACHLVLSLKKKHKVHGLLNKYTSTIDFAKKEIRRQCWKINLDSDMPICSGCYENIDDEDDCVQACDKDWHSICFKISTLRQCSVCQHQVIGSFFEKDGLIYCQKDYWNKFGEECHDCKQFISGPVMVAGDHKFHPECFKCDNCRNYIGDGESFALVERSRLYCAACYKKQMAPLSQRLPFTKEPHSIKLVEIPAHSESSNKKVKISVGCCQNQKLQHGFHELHISDVVLNKDLMSLHIGDRILEVNGKPLQNNSLEEASLFVFLNYKKLIQSRDKPVQLTVEHEPAVLIRSQSMNFSSILDSSQFLSSNEQVLPKCSLSHRPDKQRLRRSASLPRSFISKSLNGHQHDLTRTRSFRIQPKNQQIFRPSDLVLGKLLGRGFLDKHFW